MPARRFGCPQALQQPALEGEDVLPVPFHGGGHGDEAQTFTGGRAIQHNHVIAPLFIPIIDVEQGAEFLHAREDGRFLRLDLAQAGSVQQRTDVRPRRCQFFLISFWMLTS